VVDALIGVMLTTPARWQCPEGIDMDWWPQTFLFVGGWLHPELREGEALRLDGWTPGSGVETYATHTLSASTQDQGGTPMQEQATFTLRHAAYAPRTPAPAPLASAFDPPEQI
jgi:hypothetical protein